MTAGQPTSGVVGPGDGRSFSSNFTVAPPVLWASAYHDMSGIALHENELSALRYAHEHRMDIVKEVRCGVDLLEQLR